MFEIETIPNEDFLFYRIHITYLREGRLTPGAFKEQGEGNTRGMSTDWDKYSNPIDLLNRVLLREKNPDNYGVVQGNVGETRSVNLIVTHTPLQENQAHTNITSLDANLVEMRVHLLRIFSNWVIQVKNQ